MTLNIMTLTELKKNTNDLLDSFKQLTHTNHDVINTNIIPEYPKHSWFDSLKNLLDQLKTTSSQWINNLGPTIWGTISLSNINFGTSYAALSSEIVEIYNANPNSKGNDNKYVKEVVSLIAAINDAADQVINDSKNAIKQINDWYQKLLSLENELMKFSPASKELSAILKVIKTLLLNAKNCLSFYQLTMDSQSSCMKQPPINESIDKGLNLKKIVSPIINSQSIQAWNNLIIEEEKTDQPKVRTTQLNPSLSKKRNENVI